MKPQLNHWNTSMSSSLISKKVLVIGNGAAGSQLAAKLAKNNKYKVTVITPFDYQEVSICMTKALAVGPKEHDKVIYPLLREENVEYVVEPCVSLTENAATVASGRVIAFDVCVVATGQNIPLFYPDLKDSTTAARKSTISKAFDDISKAQSIVISGGGPVGTELAADIKLRFKNKKVAVIHPQGTVLSMMNKPFPELATQHLKDIDIDLYLSERVSSNTDHDVTLASGKVIPCDLFIPAHAIGGNSSFLPAGSVDDRGYVVVDDTLKVSGFNHIFALGDCSNYDTVKTYPKIDDQMPVVLFNIEAAFNNTPFKHHVKGASFMGKLNGPGLVAFGHGLDEGWGVGPDLPGCLGGCCWFCCFCGWPCSPPVGHASSKAKSDFNLTVKPKPGVGLH